MSADQLHQLGFCAGLVWIPMFIWMFLIRESPMKQTLSEKSLEKLTTEAVNKGATVEGYRRHIENLSSELNINGIPTQNDNEKI